MFNRFRSWCRERDTSHNTTKGAMLAGFIIAAIFWLVVPLVLIWWKG